MSDAYPEAANIVMPRELVQVMYDLAINSLDFGSNFWDREDHRAVQQIAEILGVRYPDCGEWLSSFTRTCAEPKGHAGRHKATRTPAEE